MPEPLRPIEHPASPQFVSPQVVYAAAQAYVAAGLSVLPIAVDGSKQPARQLLPRTFNASGEPKHSWRPYQTRLPTAEEVQRFFVGPFVAPGIAVVCGQVSGGLEVIDLDSFDLAQPWAQLVCQQDPSFLQRLVFSQTPRPGLHCFYRCPAVGRNQKLAERVVRNPETGLHARKTLIETRGEGGYCIVPPSSGWVHPSGRPYVFLYGRDLTLVPTITEAQRDILLNAARSFNAVPAQPPRPIQQRPRSAAGPLTDRPGDHFNHRADWGELLRRHKWSLSHVDDDGTEHWCRPGKSGGTSATVGYEGSDLLHVFSSNAAPLQPETGYTKFSFIAIMEFGGDFEAAARALQAKGYGRPQRILLRPHYRRRRRRPG